MSKSQNVNNGNNIIDTSKIKLGVKASDLKLEGTPLSLFNNSDQNHNGKLDTEKEVSLFTSGANSYNASKGVYPQQNRNSDIDMAVKMNERLNGYNSDLFFQGASSSEIMAFGELSANEQQDYLRTHCQTLETLPSTSDNTAVRTPTLLELERQRTAQSAENLQQKARVHRQEIAQTLTPEQKKDMKLAVSYLQENYNQAKASFDQQMKKDGWAADVADAVAHVWNNDVICLTGNTADMVRDDLAKYKQKIKPLNNSIDNGNFEEQFRATFGIRYNADNVKKYETAKAEYEELFAEVHAPEILNEATKAERTKIQSYEKCKISGKKMNDAKFAFIQKVQQMMGKTPQKTYDPKTIDNDYKEYKKFYDDLINSLSKGSAQKQKKLRMKENELKNARRTAFGNSKKNDIIERVENYNASQDAGAACVKFVASTALSLVAPGGVVGAFVFNATTSFAMDAADAMTNGIEGDFDLRASTQKALLNGVFGSVNRGLVNKYAGNLSAKILNTKASQYISNKVGSKLTNLVVKEVISKEMVKLPSYAVESITNSVAQNMGGINDLENLEEVMSAVSDAMVYLGMARDNGQLSQNISQKEMVALIDEHVAKSMKGNTKFSKWMANQQNKAKLQKMLNEMVKNELPKLKGQFKVENQQQSNNNALDKVP